MEIQYIICPKCGDKYTGIPATSRTDNRTLICTECGIRESLEYIGVDKSEIDNIVSIVKKYEKRCER